MTLDTHPALANQMALLEIVFENAPVGLGVVDRELKYQRVNSVLAAINGISEAGHLGRTPFDVVPSMWDQIEPVYRAVLRGETIANVEMSGIIAAGSRAGETSHWLSSFYPVRGDGEVTGIGIVVSDVTELRHYRESLRTRTDLYAMIARTSRAVVERRSPTALFEEVCRLAIETGQFLFAWIGVPDGDHVRVVASAGQDNGYLSRLVVTLVDDDPRSHGPTGRAIRTGTQSVANDFLGTEITAPWHAMGASAGFKASAALPFFEHDTVVATLGLYAGREGFFTPELLETLGEISPIVSFALEAMAAEEDNRRDYAALRLRDRVIHAVSSGICITDVSQPDNPMVFVSPGFERVTGYAAAEMLGKNCRLLQGPETDAATLKQVREAIAAGRACNVELLNYRKDGVTFWNELALSPVADEHGTLTHFVGVQTDVSERHRLEQQLRQSQKMQAVGQLASGVAHDFNNLLTVIEVCSDLLGGMLKQQPEALELCIEVQKAGERASTLTRQLLAFSRRQVIAPRVVDVNELVRNSQSMLRRMIGEHIILAAELGPLPALVLVDPGQLEQVLINLAVNASDAMSTGGRLTVATRLETLDAPRGALLAGPHTVIEVSDTGSGMGPAILAQMFEPFFTTKMSGQGTGLGLATVHSIIEQAHGDVTVESAIGAGTTFRVYLPSHSSELPELETRALPGAMPRGDETILLVEDDDAVRALSLRALRTCGYTVLVAAGGNAALEFARSYPQPIHLLVSDVVMPHLGGRKLAEAVEAIRPGIKVMFVSGYTDDQVLLHGVVHSEVALLQKPYSLATLAQAVRRVIDGEPL